MRVTRAAARRSPRSSRGLSEDEEDALSGFAMRRAGMSRTADEKPEEPSEVVPPVSCAMSEAIAC